MHPAGMTPPATIVGMLTTTFAQSAIDSLDDMPVGSPPSGRTRGATGGRSPNWTAEPDAFARTPPNVFKQLGARTFPWPVKSGVATAGGHVEAGFKPVAGREDPAGGLMWRLEDRDSDQVTRANALEDDVSLDHAELGRRMTIRCVDAPVAPRKWHHPRVEVVDLRIKAALDGKLSVDVQERNGTRPGNVAAWAEAGRMTAFDDLAYGRL